MNGIVYLLHFAEKYYHAQHYLGWTDSLAERLARHRAGNGSKLVRAFLQSGIDFVVARTWKGNRNKERRLKKRKKSRQLCPICKANRETY